ncbi:RNA polymerase III subunit K [Dermatophagoides pteronyssinus]|uniref:RNA polymerase III subunit K n=1 Tax=Dermatophagoides pteronyssinus TaxID=6956 RepID=UPI003F676E70
MPSLYIASTCFIQNSKFGIHFEKNQNQIMELSFRDYFCDFCGGLLCFSSSKFFTKDSYNIGSSNVDLSCYQCNSTFKKGITSLSFVPLRQILKAEIIKDSDQWASASITDEKCPKCTHNRAYYIQMQTRSADEPMTTYYRCEKCAHNWKE